MPTNRKPGLQPESRQYKSCDAARIARYAVADDPELTPEQVLACIAKGFNFTTIALSRQRTVESSVFLGKGAFDAGIVVLKKSLPLLLRIKQFPRVLGPVIAAIQAIIKYLDTVENLLTRAPQADVDDIITKDKCSCHYTSTERVYNDDIPKEFG
jgi:hypothetical protein